jgi:hypothetical protein
MVEFSIPELFATNRRKLGEVLIRADLNRGAHEDFYQLARVPDSFLLFTGGRDNHQFIRVASGLRDHVPLYGCE